MVSSGLLHHVALVRTDLSEEPGASFIMVTKIGALGTTQAATSNRRTLRRNNKFLQEPHGVTTQKTPFFMTTKVLGIIHRPVFYLNDAVSETGLSSSLNAADYGQLSTYG
jgi:hypothetical protein